MVGCPPLLSSQLSFSSTGLSSQSLSSPIHSPPLCLAKRGGGGARWGYREPAAAVRRIGSKISIFSPLALIQPAADQVRQAGGAGSRCSDDRIHARWDRWYPVAKPPFTSMGLPSSSFFFLPFPPPILPPFSSKMEEGLHGGAAKGRGASAPPAPLQAPLMVVSRRGGDNVCLLSGPSPLLACPVVVPTHLVGTGCPSLAPRGQSVLSGGPPLLRGGVAAGREESMVGGRWGVATGDDEDTRCNNVVGGPDWRNAGSGNNFLYFPVSLHRRIGTGGDGVTHHSHLSRTLFFCKLLVMRDIEPAVICISVVVTCDA
jgi:hypothetical protein